MTIYRLKLENVTYEILKDEKPEDLENLGHALWGLLANSSLCHTHNYILMEFDGELRLCSYLDLSGSFRYNGRQIAEGINKILGTEVYDYLDFYCTYGTEKDRGYILDKLTKAGYIWKSEFIWKR